MKKKIFLFIVILAVLTCLFAVVANAETPSKYIEFGAKFPGSDEYITVYTENAESSSNPRINFATKKFYSDVDFTNEVDMSTATGIDFSVTKTYVDRVQGNAVTRMTKPSSPLTNCVEVKWFLAGMPTVSYDGSFFQGWTSLKSFDFGNATAIADNTFQNCGFETITIPATITSFGGSAFRECQNLKSVKIEGVVTKFGNGNTFYNCPLLESVEISEGVTFIPESMFYKCSALKNVSLPTSITEIKGSAFRECTALTSITIPEKVTKIGNLAFYKAGILSLHIPASVESLGYQVAEESAIVSLTFAENSNLTFIDHRAFMNCKSLEGVVILPDGLEEIDYGLFSSCVKLKAVKIPDSVTKYTENTAMFAGCSSLEFVQLSKNVDTIPGSMFENCSSLKAISIPEGVKYINGKALRNCKNLQAIYLPSTLERMGITDSGTDKGAFYQSNNVYFVQEPFDVFNGNELIGDSFVMPEKPNVYYMPENLNSLGNSEFQDCKKLNSYIVFPESVTSASGCSQGAFHGVGNSTSPVTVVFLGDMTAFNIRQNDATYSNISFVFANPNDKDLNSLTITIGSSGTNKLQTNTYMYFCAGDVVYDLGTFKAPNSTVYTVLETDFAKTTDKQSHVAEPSKTVVTDPTCLKGRGEKMYCYCGAEAGFVEVEGTALGHEYDTEKGATKLSVAYENYLEKGTLNVECARCDVCADFDVAPIIADFKGFSVNYDGDAITFGYVFNNDAIKEFEEVNKTTLEFGFVAGVKALLGDKMPLDEGATNVVKAEINKAEYQATDFVLRGNWDRKVTINEEEVDIKNVEFYMAGYMICGDTVVYLNWGGSSSSAGYITFAQCDAPETIE